MVNRAFDTDASADRIFYEIQKHEEKLERGFLPKDKEPSTKEYTYIILGKSRPTGKTSLCKKLKEAGYTAFEISEDINPVVEYHYPGCNRISINEDMKHVVIILNKGYIWNKESRIKSAELCKTCVYMIRTGSECEKHLCYDCKMGYYDENSCSKCRCSDIKDGEECSYYKEEKTND